MARNRRKKHKKSRSRSSGMRGITGGVMGNIMPTLTMVAGALLGKIIVNKALASSTMDAKIKSAVPIALGVGLRIFSKGHGIMADLGNGMIVVGGVALATSTIPGLEGITEADIYGIEEDIMVGGDEMYGIEQDIMVGDPQLEGTDYSME